MNIEALNILIKAAKKNDQKAFSTLLTTYWDDIYRLQLSKSRNEEEAEDITVNTFSKAFDKIHTYNENYSFKNWLIAIAGNLFIDTKRKEKSMTVSIQQDEKKAYKIFDETPSVEDQLIQEQQIVQLKTYIKRLNPRYQLVIKLRYFQEMSYKDIALELDEPLSNIKIKILRAKRLLADIIKNAPENGY